MFQRDEGCLKRKNELQQKLAIGRLESLAYGHGPVPIF
jgi:hypothetical protein